MKLRTNPAGFTIVELMIATVVFSVILTAASIGLIHVGRMYYKGIVSTRTQAAARNVIDSISRPIQFSGAKVNAPPAEVDLNATGLMAKAFCIDNQRYSYALNAQVSDNNSLDGSYDTSTHRARHALWRDVHDGDCTPADLTQASPTNDGEELLGQHMRLKTLQVSEVNDGLWKIDLEIMYGDDDLIRFEDPDTKAKPAQCAATAGNEWCVLTILNTEVKKRL